MRLSNNQLTTVFCYCCGGRCSSLKDQVVTQGSIVSLRCNRCTWGYSFPSDRFLKILEKQQEIKLGFEPIAQPLPVTEPPVVAPDVRPEAEVEPDHDPIDVIVVVRKYTQLGLIALFPEFPAESGDYNEDYCLSFTLRTATFGVSHYANTVKMTAQPDEAEIATVVDELKRRGYQPEVQQRVRQHTHQLRKEKYDEHQST